MLVSELLALSAAVCIALSGMLISELKGRVDVIRLARWQMLASFAMTAAAATLFDGWQTIGAREFWLLALSGLFGIIIASTTYFTAIYVAGPRQTALLFTLASPFSLLLGYAFLGETISASQAVGVGLVLAGILMAIGMRRRETVPAVEGPAAAASSVTEIPPPLTPPRKGEGYPEPPAAALSNRPAPLPFEEPRDAGANVGESPSPLRGGVRGGGIEVSGAIQQTATLGIALGVVTALGQALGSLVARPAMEAGVEPAAAMAVRSGVAAVFFLALALVPWKALHQPYTFKKPDLGIAVASAFFGTGLGMSLLMAALSTGNVGIVTTLSSMTPIMILPMVWLRSGVAPVKAAWIGAAIAVIGTALISL